MCMCVCVCGCVLITKNTVFIDCRPPGSVTNICLLLFCHCSYESMAQVDSGQSGQAKEAQQHPSSGVCGVVWRPGLEAREA